jgi:hypothetical protein
MCRSAVIIRLPKIPDLYSTLVDGKLALGLADQVRYDADYISTVQQQGGSPSASVANTSINHIREQAIGPVWVYAAMILSALKKG